MMALTVVMYMVSATHWALDIAGLYVLWSGYSRKEQMIELFNIYLPTINVRLCLKTYLANIVANSGQVHVK